MVRTRLVPVLFLIAITGTTPACGSVTPSTSASKSPFATSTPSVNPFVSPCSFLTQPVAAEMSGDSAVTIRAANVAEAGTGFVACIFADARNEANSVQVQIKRSSDSVGPSTVAQAVTFFSGGEPVAPFRPFPVDGVGDDALGEATPGVAFIVFSIDALLVYVGASSADVSGAALRNSVQRLAELVAAGL